MVIWVRAPSAGLNHSIVGQFVGRCPTGGAQTAVIFFFFFLVICTGLSVHPRVSAYPMCRCEGVAGSGRADTSGPMTPPPMSSTSATVISLLPSGGPPG